MADTAYTYNIATETANGRLNVVELIDAIHAATAFTVGFRRIDTLGGTLADGVIVGGSMDVVMKDPLNKPDLDAIVNAHPGTLAPADGDLTVTIDDSSDKVITGTIQWDRDGGGVLVPPSGTAFPGTPVPLEFFYRSDEQKLYQRNAANSAWAVVADGTVGPAPVLSVNGQTGAVTLAAADVGADPAGTGAAAAAAAVATHEGLADPHPVYTTTAEAAAAAPVQSVNGSTGAVSLAAGDVGADPAGTAAAAVSAHEGLADPHTQYTTAAEAAAAAPVQQVNGQTGNVSLGAGDVGADSAGSAAAVQGNLTTHINDTDNPHATDLGNLGAGTYDELNAALSDANPIGVVAFGQSQAVSTTTSTTFQNKVSVSNAIDLPAGNYVWEVSYGWNGDSTTADFEARLTFNGTQIGELHKQEPKDSAGGDPTGTTQRHYITRQYFFTLGSPLAAGQTFNLDYRSDTGGNEASIWEAVSMIKRIG